MLIEPGVITVIVWLFSNISFYFKWDDKATHNGLWHESTEPLFVSRRVTVLGHFIYCCDSLWEFSSFKVCTRHFRMSRFKTKLGHFVAGDSWSILMSVIVQLHETPQLYPRLIPPQLTSAYYFQMFQKSYFHDKSWGTDTKLGMHFTGNMCLRKTDSSDICCGQSA